jgi:hypothetical protein
MTLDERPELAISTTATPEELPLVEFEGDLVRTMLGKIPGFEIEMPVGYRRGTHLKFELEVRIRNVAVNEDRKGELSRMHTFALEEIKLVGAYTADQLDPGVGGSASVSSNGMGTTASDDRLELEAAPGDEGAGDVGF